MSERELTSEEKVSVAVDKLSEALENAYNAGVADGREIGHAEEQENRIGMLCKIGTLGFALDHAVAKCERLYHMLIQIEHVSLPGAKFKICPVCLSPNDFSQPHEDGCALRAALAESERGGTE